MLKESMKTILDLKVGAPKTVKNLTLFPLSGNPASLLDYLMIDLALDSNQAPVEEVSEGGSVPELRLVNKSEKVLLVPDGTELVGAKQNRIVNATLLIPPKSTTKIPVSCVEQGRWGYRTQGFRSSPHHAAHRLRKEMLMHQKMSLKEKRGYESDQGKIWSEVRNISDEVGFHSPTSALHDVYEGKKGDIEDYLGKFKVQAKQTGAVFFLGDRFEGLELFDKPSTFSKLFKKILSGVTLGALASKPVKGEIDVDGLRDEVTKLFGEFDQALFEKYNAPVGIGEDWRYEGQISIGKCLYFEGDLIHFSAFAL